MHAKLAQAYERINDRKRSLRQFLILAYYFRRDNDNERAIRAVERALKIDPRNSFALNGLNALRAGGELVMPPEDADVAPHVVRHSAARLDADFESVDEDDKAMSEGDPRGPIGESLNQALSMLAAHVLETGMLDATGADALKAMELQRQDARTEAIDAYLRALPRLNHPALKMNLGVLLLQADRPQESVAHLGEVLNVPQLRIGALHALGMANARLGKQQHAARFLVQCLQSIETDRNKAPRAEVERVYRGLVDALEEANDGILVAINQRFLRTLSGKEWPQRVETCGSTWMKCCARRAQAASATSWAAAAATSWPRRSSASTGTSARNAFCWRWTRRIKPSRKRRTTCLSTCVWPRSWCAKGVCGRRSTSTRWLRRATWCATTSTAPLRSSTKCWRWRRSTPPSAPS
ncbi:MAG: hypothetical protein IPM16_12545 [Chloroflexi bacterium]|nr:hypothetical protein [Chloroflexota bacterium]